MSDVPEFDGSDLTWNQPDFNVGMVRGIIGPGWTMTWITSESATNAAIEEYLDNLHSTTWGQTFDVVNTTTRPNAIAFIKKLIVDLGLVAFMTEDEEEMLAEENPAGPLDKGHDEQV